MEYYRALEGRRRVRMDNYRAYRKSRVREVAREVRRNGLEEDEDNKAAFPVAKLGLDTPLKVSTGHNQPAPIP